MSLNCVVKGFVHYPFVILSSIAFLSILSVVITFNYKSLPNFSDPTMGFETRGTPIAQRVTAWKNFYEEIQPSGSLTGNPHEYLTYFNQSLAIMGNDTGVIHKESGIVMNRKRKQKNGKKKKVAPTHGKIITKEGNKTDKSPHLWKQLHKLLSNVSNDKSMRMEREDFFCGPPDDNYVQFVVKSDTNEDLFNHESLIKICRIETELMKVDLYTNLCLEDEKWLSSCCRAWSLPNYIALLTGRPNCFAITEEDVNNTLSLLQNCSSYYHRELLELSCYDPGACMAVPIQCRQYDAVHTILNFLSSKTFLPKNDSSKQKLEETMIFLPMARSIATLPFYSKIENMPLSYEGVSIVAMEFGAKNELFDEILLKDTRLMVIGACFVLICMWTYTCSIFLTIMTVVAIVFSLGVSYFLYVYVFNLEFFPFMNLLAVVVIIGIGADDAFIFCKMWHTMKANNSNNNTLFQIMISTLYHALISMFVTSITTAIAFLASYLSSITAIRCFGLFAGTSIIMNYFLIVTWLPASVIIWEKYPILRCSYFDQIMTACCTKLNCTLGALKEKLLNLQNNSVLFHKCRKRPEKGIAETIVRYKYIFAIIFTLIAVIASVIVFYYPKLEIQRTNELQLFETSHLFEQYDLIYKNKFAFKTFTKSEDPTYLHLPLRFVWGILPIDNGNYLNPKESGTLVYDQTFNISTPEAQTWILAFCRNLRMQAFYQPTQGALLTNCFIETFISWMARPCLDPIDNDLNRFPCCNETSFPFEADVFDACIIDAQNDLHHTPPIYLVPTTAGLRFTKTDMPKIQALVIEYDSNYTYFTSYEEIAKFIETANTWLAEELITAPESMQNGFFISDLEFFDLQRALPQNTILAVSISMTLALIVLFLATLNFTHSLLAIFTITCSILTIMAMLVLLGWKLNILESVAISSTIGFAVDYCLHYAVNYKLCPNMGENREVVATMALTRMLGPTAMGALTSGAAGAFMIPSSVLAYKQIGQFLVIVTIVSWLFATFHLGSLLAIAGPENNFGHLYFSKFGVKFIRSFWRDQCSKQRNTDTADPHEVESLAVRFDNTENKDAQGQRDAIPTDQKYQSGNDVLLSQSPSNSAITFITTEDNQY